MVVLNVDHFGHQAYKKGSEAFHKLVDYFGEVCCCCCSSCSYCFSSCLNAKKKRKKKIGSGCFEC